jgi:hypothetical protein
MNDWQPIETAPKDGSSILICQNRQKYPSFRVAYFDAEADPKYPWAVEDSDAGFHHHKDWPTHWMRLPDAPPNPPRS